VKGRDERRQPRSGRRRDRGAQAGDALGCCVDRDDRPAVGKKRQRLRAVPAAEVVGDARPVRELERVGEELSWRAAFDLSVVVLPHNPGHLGTVDTLPVYERRWWADHSTNRS
jgi:hypothetical protein